MKKATEYAKRIKRLMTTIKPHASTDVKMPATHTDKLVRCVLIRYAGEEAAAAAHARLSEAMVDLNELRVTPIAGVVDQLTHSFPQARYAAESITRALRGIYNRCHHLNLEQLDAMNKKDAREYVESLDGLDPVSSALAVGRILGQHVIPLDDDVLVYLRENEYVDPAAERGEVQGFLDRNIPSGKADYWFNGMRGFLATQNTRKSKPAAKKKTATKSSAAKTTTKKKKAAQPATESRRVTAKHR